MEHIDTVRNLNSGPYLVFLNKFIYCKYRVDKHASASRRLLGSKLFSASGASKFFFCWTFGAKWVSSTDDLKKLHVSLKTG